MGVSSVCFSTVQLSLPLHGSAAHRQQSWP
jgi:hypothetical protein